MKFLKSLLLSLFAFALVTMGANAKTQSAFTDVDESYWAYTEIQSVVQRGYMTKDAGAFKPEEAITRVEFVKSLLLVLNHSNVDVSAIKNKFTDVNEATNGYAQILKSEDLGLVYGYPNKTFLPERNMTRAEVSSVISHITKGMPTDLSVLRKFKDVALIPTWAKKQFAKTVKMDLYVNHPDVMAFEPNRDMTRAETAVLLYKLRNSLDLVQNKYKNKEVTLGTEHLNVSENAASNIVTITNLRKIIREGNWLKVAFDEKYRSRKSDVGDSVGFIFTDDVYTKEGTLVIPKGSTIKAQVVELIPTKWFNKNARVGLRFTELTINGKTISMDAIPATKDGYLKEGPWETTGKVAAYTLGGTALGAGVGVAAGVPTEHLDRGLGIGIPVGAGVGLIAGFVSKGLNFVGHEGDTLFIKLVSDLSVFN